MPPVTRISTAFTSLMAAISRFIALPLSRQHCVPVLSRAITNIFAFEKKQTERRRNILSQFFWAKSVRDMPVTSAFGSSSRMNFTTFFARSSEMFASNALT